MKPMSGLKAPDLTHVLAGPYRTQQLGLLGAEITKVEAPIADITRNTSIAASTGLPPAPADNREAPLLGRYRSKDRYIRLAGYFPDHCQAICAAVCLPEYADPSN